MDDQIKSIVALLLIFAILLPVIFPVQNKQDDMVLGVFVAVLAVAALIILAGYYP